MYSHHTLAYFQILFSAYLLLTYLKSVMGYLTVIQYNNHRSVLFYSDTVPSIRVVCIG